MIHSFTICMEVLLLNSISARAALILGPQSGLVCPCCLVPKEFLWDLSEVIYPLRTRNGTLQLMQKADACNTKQKAYAVLLEQSIRNIPVCMSLKRQQVSDLQPQNTFLNHFSQYIVVYSTFCAETLHPVSQGVWGQHLWKVVKEEYLSLAELQILDDK